MIKACLLTNIPVPYREKIHEFVNENFGGDYTVIYYSKTEDNRSWSFKLGAYKYEFLKASSFKFKNRTVHINYDVFKVLNKHKPDVIIVSGLGPTSFLSILWAKLKKRPVIPFTDAFLLSEKSLGLNRIQILLRKIIYKKAKALIGASKGSKDLYMHYGADPKQVYISSLCIDNDFYTKTYLEQESRYQRKYDIIYSGRLTKDKNIQFFIDVVLSLKKIRQDLTVLIIGDGKEKDILIDTFTKHQINFNFAGFIDQEDLPKYYMQARLLLLPTKRDAWGLVCNEAMVVGTPVVVTPFAGAANDLVINEHNGLVLSLELDLWIEKINSLLSDANILQQLSENARKHVLNYNFKSASQGIIDAINSVKQ